MENCLRPVAEVKSELQALKLDTFLFDLGGVLVNDLDLNYDASIRIFKMLGKRAFTKEEYLANLMPIQNLYKFVGLNQEESRESERLFKQFMIRGLDSIVIQPDAKPTLETLKERGLKLGLVTQYPHAVADRLLSQIGIRTFFDTVVGFEDSNEQKPSPKPVLIALDRLRSVRQTSLIVGDMKQDIMAGHSAGVQTVGIYRGKSAYHTREMLQEANPDLIIDDLAELTRLLW